MKISTKGKYALILLLDIAENPGREYVSLNDVAQRRNISKKYLEQIVSMLVRPGIIRAGRGNKGGYRLNKNPDQCTVGEILRATEGIPVIDEDNENCSEIMYVWEGLFEVINRYADSISLQDIIEHSRKFDDYMI